MAGRQRDYSPYAEAKLSPDERAAKQEAWNKDLAQHWSVDTAKGEIVSDGKGVYLCTNKDYRDFEMYVDWLMVSHNGDSGMYLRSVPQVQIWDPDNPHEVKNGAAERLGRTLEQQRRQPRQMAPGEGRQPGGAVEPLSDQDDRPRVWVWFNDKLTVDGQILDNYFNRKLAVLPTGPLQLQTHGSEIRFRNIFIREIGDEEANRALDEMDDQGFASLFNGKNLDGWKGSLDSCEVKEGAIYWKHGTWGTLYANDDYADFEAKLEFKLPPAGNNGLAIRYPGKGDTAYTGMCEIQVLDDTDKAYANLDPRQFCGGVYGVIARKRVCSDRWDNGTSTTSG